MNDAHLAWDQAVQYGHTGKDRPSATALRQAILWAHRRLQDYEAGNQQLLDDLGDATSLQARYEAAMLQLSDPARTFARADDVEELFRRFLQLVARLNEYPPPPTPAPILWAPTPMDNKFVGLLDMLVTSQVIEFNDTSEADDV